MKKSELEEALKELQYRYNKLHSDTRIEMEIHMGGKYLTSVDGEICMKENTLEW